MTDVVALLMMSDSDGEIPRGAALTQRIFQMNDDAVLLMPSDSEIPDGPRPAEAYLPRPPW